MNIDLPLDADPQVIFQTAEALGVQVRADKAREVNTFDVGRVLRAQRVRLLPVGDVFRAFTVPDGQPSRRKNAVCFHGHRDWMRAILAAYPQTVIRTSRATYRGDSDFESKHGYVTLNETCACQG